MASIVELTDIKNDKGAPACAIISSQWFTEDNKHCYSPPFLNRYDYNKAVITNMKPTDDWSCYKVRHISSFRDFTEANSNFDRACQTSDLSDATCGRDDTGRPTRKRVAKRPYSPFQSSDDGERDDVSVHEDDMEDEAYSPEGSDITPPANSNGKKSNVTITLPELPAFPTKSVSQDKQKKFHSSVPQQQRAKKIVLSSFVSPLVKSFHPIQHGHSSHYTTHDSSEGSGSGTALKESSAPEIRTGALQQFEMVPKLSQPPQALNAAVLESRRILPSGSSLPETTSTIGTRSSEFESFVIKELLHLRKTLKEHGAMLSSLLTVKRKNSLRDLDFSDLPQFPFTTMDEFVAFDSSLSEMKNMYNKMVLFCSTKLCSSISESIGEIVNSVLIHDLQLGMNWRGDNGKFAFEKSTLKNVIYESLNDHPAGAVVSLDDKKGALQKWIRGAKDRNGGRAERMKRSVMKNLASSENS